MTDMGKKTTTQSTEEKKVLDHLIYNNEDYKISDVDLLNWKTSFSTDRQDGEIVSDEKQITFTWCNINAFSIDQPPTAFVKSDTQSIFGKSETKIQMKHILRNVNGVAYPGELLVIMGSSGAGKTTLLNCMTHRNMKGLTVSGAICINSRPVTQIELAAQSAYVQQDDLFIPYLTVKEHLIFQSLLRMNSKFTFEERMERIEVVMKELSLAKCAHNQIGNPGIIKGISGGERKRLALASELLTNPSLLFCDEPTTGLDSFMALNVIQMLKSCARTGRTVIATIHQPSSEVYHIFDKLCLIAEGRTAFLGTTAEANAFFSKLQAPCPSNFNPADYYNQVLSIIPGKEETCRSSVERICDAFKSSSLGVKLDKNIDKITKSTKDEGNQWFHRKGQINPYRAGWFTQLYVLLWRGWLAVIKNPAVTRRRIYIVVAESILVILIYYGQRMNQVAVKNLDGALYLILNSTAFDSAFAVVNAFCAELPLFNKEHKDGMYRADVYFLSKVLCDMPLCLFFPILFTAMCYYFVGLNPLVIRFMITILIAMALSQAGTGIGYIASTLASSEEVANQRLLLLMVPAYLMGGIYLNLSSIPVILTWLSNFSFIKYAYEAFMVNQWSDVSHIACSTNSTSSSICIQNGLQVLELNSMNPFSLWPDIGYLIVLAILFRIIAFFILLFKVSRSE